MIRPANAPAKRDPLPVSRYSTNTEVWVPITPVTRCRTFPWRIGAYRLATRHSEPNRHHARITPPPVRVLLLSHTAAVSGAERSLIALAGGLQARPSIESVGVACPAGDLTARLGRDGIRALPITGTTGSLAFHPIRTPRALAEIARSAMQLRRLCTSERVEVLHANSVRAALIAMAAPVPVVVHVRDVLPPGRASGLIRRLVLARAAHVVTISRFVRDRFTSGLPAHRRTPVSVVDNPVDLSAFELQRVGTAPQGMTDGSRPLIAVVGQLTHWKGQDTAIEALAGIREAGVNARLAIVGAVKFADAATRFDNTTYVDGLHALVTRLALDEHVAFLGEREDVPAIMAAADLVLVPSIEEPFGRTVVEALAAGTPVIATSVGGPSEIIEDGRSGLLVPPGDAEAWTDAALKVLRDPDLAGQLVDAGRALVPRYSHERHAATMAAILAEAARD